MSGKNKEESLSRWFKEKWVDVSRKDKSGKHPECGADDSDKEGYPKCRPSKKVNSKTPRTSGSYSKKQKKSMTQSKRTKEKNAPSKSAGGGARKPKMSNYKPRNESIEIDIMEIIKETILEEWAQIDEGKLCARGKAAAKAKYDVYPGAYANGYAVQVCTGDKPGLDGKKRAASGYSKNEGHDGGCGCGTCDGCDHEHGEGGMAQNQLSVLANSAAELTQMFSEQSDLPEWVESKITKAADYISSIRNYLNGNLARDLGALEEQENCGCGQTPCITYGRQSESVIEEEVFCEVDIHHDLHEILQGAMTEDNEKACPECLYEVMVDSACDCSEMLSEAEYRGRKVKLNKPSQALH